MIPLDVRIAANIKTNPSFLIAKKGNLEIEKNITRKDPKTSIKEIELCKNKIASFF
jgi:hypothetical protein